MKTITILGETGSISYHAKRLGISDSTIRRWIHFNRNLDEALVEWIRRKENIGEGIKRANPRLPKAPEQEKKQEPKKRKRKKLVFIRVTAHSGYYTLIDVPDADKKEEKNEETNRTD